MVRRIAIGRTVVRGRSTNLGPNSYWGKKIVHKVNKLGKIVHSAKGQVVTTGSGNVTSGTPVCICLNKIALGDGTGDRTGDKIIFKDMVFRCQIVNITAGVVTGFVRVLIFIDKQMTGTLPDGAAVYGANTEDIALMAELVYKYNERYRVIHDRIYRFTATAAGESSKIMISKKFRKSIAGIATKFTGTTAADGSCGRNSLFVLFSSGAHTAGQSPTYNLYNTLNYYE